MSDDENEHEGWPDDSEDAEAISKAVEEWAARQQAIGRALANLAPRMSVPKIALPDIRVVLPTGQLDRALEPIYERIAAMQASVLAASDFSAVVAETQRRLEEFVAHFSVAVPAIDLVLVRTFVRDARWSGDFDTETPEPIEALGRAAASDEELLLRIQQTLWLLIFVAVAVMGLIATGALAASSAGSARGVLVSTIGTLVAIGEKAGLAG